MASVPSGLTTRMPYNRPGAARSMSATNDGSRRASSGVAAGLRYSEHGLSRGKRARSSSSTLAPARAASNAVAEPAGPAPTTMTSQSALRSASGAGDQSRRAQPGEQRADERAGHVHQVVVQPPHAAHQVTWLMTVTILRLVRNHSAYRAGVTGLERRSQQGVGEHADATRARHDGCGPPTQCRGDHRRKDRDRDRPGETAGGAERGDTPRAPRRDACAGGDEAWWRGGEGAELGGPG